MAEVDDPMEMLGETVEEEVAPPTPSLNRGPEGIIDTQGNVYATVITDEQQLMRFLVIGSEGGNYYASEEELRTRNVASVKRLIDSGQGEMVVEKVVEVLKRGRCVRVNSALLVLALCCRSTDAKTKSAAYRSIQEVCNIPTHLFKYIKYMKDCRAEGKTAGWGRGLRQTVARWYNKFADDPRRLAMLVTKYKQREGWSHADVLRLSHVKPTRDVVGFILRYVRKGLREAKEYYLEDGMVDVRDPRFAQIVRYLEVVEEVGGVREQACHRSEDFDPRNDQEMQKVLALIGEFDLVREHLPSFMLRFAPVWRSLLEKMPMMALMRNMNRITRSGLLQDPENKAMVLEKLGNREALRLSKVHPYAILTAWHRYRAGRGLKGSLRWEPVVEVTQAMEQAFYAAFGNVQPTNKRILVALDVSGSMTYSSVTSPGGESGITAQVASVAMSLVTIQVESCVDVVGFSNNLSVLRLQRGSTLAQALDQCSNLSFQGTDCSRPMMWATEKKKKYDAFIIYTDSETNFVRVPPAEALREYRRQSGIPNARLAVVAMSSGGFSLADPADLYMMDVVGFDTETPTVLQEFIAGTLFN